LARIEESSFSHTFLRACSFHPIFYHSLCNFLLPINNIYVSIFVALGVIFFLTGIEILFAQLIHSLRIYLWQKKAEKKKVGLKKVSMNWSIFVGAGISLGLYVGVFFIFSYYLMDPFSLVNLPIYGKFALIEILSGIIVIIAVAIIDASLQSCNF